MRIHQCFASVSLGGVWKNSHNKADGFTVRSTSLCCDIPPPPPEELRSAKRLTHHTAKELKTLYKSTWEMPVGKRPLLLLPRTCCLSASSVLLGKGVAADPTETFLPLRKPPLWRLCVISGPVNGESAGMHIEECYHHCGEEHPGQNLIFLFHFFPFFCRRASNMTCIT